MTRSENLSSEQGPRPRTTWALRKFRVLEYLDADTMLLFGVSHSLVQKYQISLPLSLQEVKLHGKKVNGGALRWHLTSFMESTETLPTISSIELFETRMSRNEAATLHEMCANVGISSEIVDSTPLSLLTFTRCSVY